MNAYLLRMMYIYEGEKTLFRHSINCARILNGMKQRVKQANTKVSLS